MNYSSINDFDKLIQKDRFNKIFIITGQNSFFKSKANNFFKFPKKKVLKFFFKKSKLPELNELIKIIKEIEKFNPDIILAIGGGAVIDYAKIASIIDIDLIKNLKKKLVLYENVSKNKVYPLIAIPTTAGAGAEVTSNAVIYINDIKYSVENLLLVPDYFFLFPNLILSNPFNLKSSAGFDAIAQGVESLISMKSDEASVMYAKKSLKLSLNNYLPFLQKPNKENSKNMLLASNLAGKAINISKTTAPHAVSYPFSSMFGIDHGHAVSITLEKFLLFNFKNINYSKSKFNLLNRYKIIFKLFNVINIGELNNKIKFLKREAQLIDEYSKLGIDINQSMNKILDQINELRLKNNPIRIKKNDIREILND
tara:strand:+ start:193 stop:1296 length:1104 start_codon:yes stop_codon:yes gene_type:complete